MLHEMVKAGAVLILVGKFLLPIVFFKLYWFGPTGCVGMSKCLCLMPILTDGALGLVMSVCFYFIRRTKKII